MTTPLKPVPVEAVEEKDGLIYGLSAEELQILSTKCINAKATAYCELSPSYRALPFAGRESLKNGIKFIVKEEG